MLLERAIKVIETHGHKAVDTVDGLIGISWEGGADWRIAEPDDQYCEASCLFPVHFEPSVKDGFAIACVDGVAVRHWLGY